MSIRVMSAAWDHYQGGGSELLALLALADWSDDNGRCYPSMSAIAAKTRLSTSQARRVVHHLIEEGVVAVVGNSFGGPPGATRQYRVVTDRMVSSALTAGTDASPTASVDARASAHARTGMDARDGRHGCAETASAHASQTVIEPSITVSTSKSVLQAGDGFAKFWANYPKKVSKSDAQKAFAKLKAGAELVDAILLALAGQKQSPDWQKDGGKFIPHPATWLNGKRWEDEIPQTPATAVGERKPWEGAR